MASKPRPTRPHPLSCPRRRQKHEQAVGCADCRGSSWRLCRWTRPTPDGAARHVTAAVPLAATRAATPPQAAMPHGHEDLPEVVYEQQNYTCYKTCYETVCENKTIDCVKYVQRDLLPQLRVHGLQAGLGNQDHATSATRSASRSTRPRPRTSATRSASRSRRPRRKRHLLHGLQAGLRDQDQEHLLHGLQAGLRDQDQGHLLHGLQAGLRDQHPGHLLHGLQAGLGDQDPRTSATRSASRSTRPRPKNICYTVCKPVYETKTQEHLLHGLQAGLRDQDQGDLLHGLQAGLRDQDQATSATRSASRSTRPRPKNICYTVCKPVYETKTNEICYTVCKPVYETKTREICYTVCKPVYETKTRRHLLHGLQAGLRDLRAGRLLYGLQAGSLHARRSRFAAATGTPRSRECPGPVITKCVQEPGCWVWDPCCCRCVLQARLLPHSPSPMPADQGVQEGLGSGSSQTQTIDCVKYVRETLHQEGALHGLPDGARATREDLHLHRSATWCPRSASRPAATRSATWCPSSASRPAPTRSATWCPSSASRPATTRSATWCPSNASRPAPTRSATWCPSNASRPAPTGLPHGARATRQDLHLHGLPHGARAARQDLQLHGLPHGARATRQDLQLQVCHMVPEQHVKTCTYTVCHMVPEQRVKTCSYTVCHMVPEQRVKTCSYTGLPHGARAAREDLQLHRSATWCPSSASRPAPTRSATWCPSSASRPAATGLPHGGREVRQASSLLRSASRCTHEDHPGATLRAQAGRLHVHPLRARRWSASKFRCRSAARCPAAADLLRLRIGM